MASRWKWQCYWSETFRLRMTVLSSKCSGWLRRLAQSFYKHIGLKFRLCLLPCTPLAETGPHSFLVPPCWSWYNIELCNSMRSDPDPLGKLKTTAISSAKKLPKVGQLHTPPASPISFPPIHLRRLLPNSEFHMKDLTMKPWLKALKMLP